MLTSRSFRRAATVKRVANRASRVTAPPQTPQASPRRVTQARPAPRPWTPPAAPQAPRSWARRHWVISILIGGPVGIMLIGIMVAMVIGMGQGIKGVSTGSIMISHTDSYHDCLALADRDSFAPEVCEGLDPNSQVAKINCAAEIKYHQAPVDCPATPAPTSTGSSQVTNFNDGFSTAKQDDCQQGDQAACQWLQTTKR